jgi:UDP-glucose 4-epimerase
MKVLVTGSSGHLGEALVRTLRVEGHEVVGLDTLPSPTTDVVGSVTQREVVQACMAGVEAVLHTATLHKPHVATHTRQQFVDTNITGTLNLLEEAVAQRVGVFVFTSTTSTFGDALAPPPSMPAAWITEDVVPAPKNIYGVTKCAAEDLCGLFHRNHGLPVVVLRTSRFFPEPDDNPARRAALDDLNLKTVELLYRRVDLHDVVTAHQAAMRAAPRLGFDRFIISATSPFQADDLPDLRGAAAEVVARRVAGAADALARLRWRMLDDIDRVYVNQRARERLGWEPVYTFGRALADLAAGQDPRSPLARSVPIKGYHGGRFADGLFPV